MQLDLLLNSRAKKKKVQSSFLFYFLVSFTKESSVFNCDLPGFELHEISFG